MGSPEQREVSTNKKKKRWVGIKRQVLKEQVQSVCEQLWKRKLPMPRSKATSKIDNDVICCYDDSYVSLTLLITNSHLCLIKLW